MLLLIANGHAEFLHSRYERQRRLLGDMRPDYLFESNVNIQHSEGNDGALSPTASQHPQTEPEAKHGQGTQLLHVLQMPDDTCVCVWVAVPPPALLALLRIWGVCHEIALIFSWHLRRSSRSLPHPGITIMRSRFETRDQAILIGPCSDGVRSFVCPEGKVKHVTAAHHWTLVTAVLLAIL